MSQFDSREALARKYRDRAAFLFIYCQEAHSGQAFGSAAASGDLLPLPGTRTWRERADRADQFRRKKGIARRLLIDEDGERSVLHLFGGKGNPLIVVGRDGRILLKQEIADPAPLGQFLQDYLAPGG